MKFENLPNIKEVKEVLKNVPENSEVFVDKLYTGSVVDGDIFGLKYLDDFDNVKLICTFPKVSLEKFEILKIFNE